MKIYKMTVVAIAAFFIFGCSSAAPTLAPKAPTPTDTLKTFIEATKSKDVESVKKTLSKGTLGIIEESAKAQNTTVDELLKKDNGSPIKEMPETRNEKIEGETATVEVKNVVTNEFDTIPFVKEEGNWKIALDKFMQDIQKKALEQMKMPSAEDGSGAAKPEGNAKPKTDK